MVVVAGIGMAGQMVPAVDIVPPPAQHGVDASVSELVSPCMPTLGCWQVSRNKAAEQVG